MLATYLRIKGVFKKVNKRWNMSEHEPRLLNLNRMEKEPEREGEKDENK